MEINVNRMINFKFSKKDRSFFKDFIKKEDKAISDPNKRVGFHKLVEAKLVADPRPVKDEHKVPVDDFKPKKNNLGRLDEIQELFTNNYLESKPKRSNKELFVDGNFRINNEQKAVSELIKYGVFKPEYLENNVDDKTVRDKVSGKNISFGNVFSDKELKEKYMSSGDSKEKSKEELRNMIMMSPDSFYNSDKEITSEEHPYSSIIKEKEDDVSSGNPSKKDMKAGLDMMNQNSHIDFGKQIESFKKQKEKEKEKEKPTVEKKVSLLGNLKVKTKLRYSNLKGRISRIKNGISNYYQTYFKIKKAPKKQELICSEEQSNRYRQLIGVKTVDYEGDRLREANRRKKSRRFRIFLFRQLSLLIWRLHPDATVTTVVSKPRNLGFKETRDIKLLMDTK